MHINLELMESVYYVCAMLLEVPSMLQYPTQAYRYSRTYRRYLQNYQRQTFLGVYNGSFVVK